jgi:dihydroflavonol-4-reductase
MRVLVTGATGFLGSWVTRALIETHCQPVVLVRRSSRLDCLRGLSLKIVEGDVLDRKSIERAAKGVQAVIHVAGLVSMRRRDREPLVHVNLEGTRNVLRAAAERGIRAIHTSSIATIGLTDHPVVLDESSEISPDHASTYPYAASKLLSEKLALDMARSGADVVVLNPGLLLGPGDLHLSSTRFLHHYLRRETPFCPSGGTSLGDVRRVAAVYPTALRRGQRGERYILAGLNRSYPEVFQLMARASGLPSAWPLPAPIVRWWALVSDAASLFVEHPLEEFSSGIVAYSTRFNYCSSAKASVRLGYQAGDLEGLIQETVADHLNRAKNGGAESEAAGAVRPLQKWLRSSPRRRDDVDRSASR